MHGLGYQIVHWNTSLAVNFNNVHSTKYSIYNQVKHCFLSNKKYFIVSSLAITTFNLMTLANIENELGEINREITKNNCTRL